MRMCIPVSRAACCMRLTGVARTGLHRYYQSAIFCMSWPVCTRELAGRVILSLIIAWEMSADLLVVGSGLFERFGPGYCCSPTCMKGRSGRAIRVGLGFCARGCSASAMASSAAQPTQSMLRSQEYPSKAGSSLALQAGRTCRQEERWKPLVHMYNHTLAG